MTREIAMLTDLVPVPRHELERLRADSLTLAMARDWVRTQRAARWNPAGTSMTGEEGYDTALDDVASRLEVGL